MAGVGALTLLIGTGTAWLVPIYRLPGRGLFQWLLLLPLASDLHHHLHCYLELFDYSGVLQTTLRLAQSVCVLAEAPRLPSGRQRCRLPDPRLPPASRSR